MTESQPQPGFQYVILPESTYEQFEFMVQEVWGSKEFQDLVRTQIGLDTTKLPSVFDSYAVSIKTRGYDGATEIWVLLQPLLTTTIAASLATLTATAITKGAPRIAEDLWNILIDLVRKHIGLEQTNRSTPPKE